MICSLSKLEEQFKFHNDLANELRLKIELAKEIKKDVDSRPNNIALSYEDIDRRLSEINLTNEHRGIIITSFTYEISN